MSSISSINSNNRENISLKESQLKPDTEIDWTEINLHSSAAIRKAANVCLKVFVVACTIAALVTASAFTFGAAVGAVGFAKFWLIWMGATCAFSATIGTPLAAHHTKMGKSTDKNLSDVCKFLFFSIAGTFLVAGAPAFVAGVRR